MISEVEESEEDYNLEDMEKYKSICFYVTNYGCGDQQMPYLKNLMAP